MKDLAVEYSQMLAEHLSEGVEEIDRLKGSVVNQVMEDHHAYLQRLVDSTKSKVDQQGTACKPDQKQKVHEQAAGTVTNR